MFYYSQILLSAARISVAGLLLFGIGCTKNEAVKKPLTLMDQGKKVYMSRCISCHNADPKKAGSIGPDVYGSNEELLKNKILHAQYPENYIPKRNTKLMTVMPDLAPDIEAIHAYLNAQ